MSTAPDTVTITADTRPIQVACRKVMAHVGMSRARTLAWPTERERNAAITDARDTLATAIDAAEGIR